MSTVVGKRRRLRSIGALLAAAVRGTGATPTEGSIPSAVVVLAVPMVLEMFVESVFAVVDIYIVSRLGSNAVAAVGLTESLFTVVYTVAVVLRTGVSAIVARRMGEGRAEAASDATLQA